ncbi:MAG: energy-coupling factor transporter transmembrane protein EcfT [Candidatus Bathyarchaeota archaeon]|nr:energy-coupling factor transporter transmembrane protein EcfT [Candidatus Bathyarchaeota archaeon]MDH5494385.1 energy-coupling factor transporter transmembrane protein EcfT [Candidatus Bathyarchaeota archaeon]
MSVFDGLKFRRVTSPIHMLDPRIKFLYVCSIFVVAILFWELLPLIILFLMQIPFVLLARVQKEWVRSLRGAAFLAVIIFSTNLFFRFMYTGYPTLQDIEYASAMTLRFVVLVESFSVFFLTTSPDHLGLALEQSHVPYEFCFAFTTAVRFVPVLADEAQTIMDAQKARGLELEKGNFLKRIRNYIPILIPLIISAIRRSLELAEAMESRAWGAIEKRTNLYVLKMRKADYLLILASILILIIGVYIRYYVPTPSFSDLLKL